MTDLIYFKGVAVKKINKMICRKGFKNITSITSNYIRLKIQNIGTGKISECTIDQFGRVIWNDWH